MTTAVITAGSAGGGDAQAQLDGHRPALFLVTGVAPVGLLMAIHGWSVERGRTGTAPAGSTTRTSARSGHRTDGPGEREGDGHGTAAAPSKRRAGPVEP